MQLHKAIFVFILGCLLYNVVSATFTLHLFQNSKARNAVCNDLTPSGYYLRTGSTNKWVVHLQGGFWCWSEGSCLSRAESSINMVSSKKWTSTMGDIGGLLSSLKSSNPDFYDANIVYAPYCTSDAWSGNGTYKIGGNSWQFRGRAVLNAIFEDLSLYNNFTNAETLLFSGCSAGGQGVINNLDYAANLARKIVPDITVKGLADAGWMMNVISIRNQSESVIYQFQQAYKIWSSIPNEQCVAANPGFEYLCLFSPFAMPFISTPLLIQTEQYDMFQTGWDCCSPPFNQKQQEFIENLRKATHISLQNIVRKPSAVFSPACFSHCLSESTNLFTQVQVDNFSLQQTLSNWYFERNALPNNNKIIDTCNGWNCSKNCPQHK